MLLLSFPAWSDFHSYPSSVGHESSGWTQQVPKLRPPRSEDKKENVACEVTGTSLLESHIMLAEEERDRGHNHNIRPSQSSLRVFRR